MDRTKHREDDRVEGEEINPLPICSICNAHKNLSIKIFNKIVCEECAYDVIKAIELTSGFNRAKFLEVEIEKRGKLPCFRDGDEW